MRQSTRKSLNRTTLLLIALALGVGLSNPAPSKGDEASTHAIMPAKMMRAAAMDRYGGPEVITLHTLPVPALQPGQVLIAVDTAPVSSWDKDVRAHASKDYPAKFPLVPGVDGAGTIAAIAPGVQGFHVGDPVYAYQWDIPSGGFYAEYVAIDAKHVGHVPPGVPLRDAAAIGVEGLTALQGIDDALHVHRGEVILIHGASGGVGVLAVQFAKLRGARVIATASGADGVALVRQLGADAVVDGRHGDIASTVRTLAPHGVDAVLALVGGQSLEQCASTLHAGGVLAYPYGIEHPPHALDHVTIIAYNANAGPAEFERLNRAILAGRVRMPIPAEFALADAAKAHERLDRGHVLGRIVLRVRDAR